MIRRRRPPPATPALVALVVVVTAACTGGGSAIEPLPPPPSTAPVPSTTPPPDYLAIPLPVAPKGRTTTTAVVVGPGRAKLEGRVIGPDGVGIEAATVRIERMVGGAKAGMDVATGPDGGWALPDVLGGGYRVRAWRAPDLSMLQPALIFLGAADTTALELKLERFGGVTPTPAIAPNPPVVGQPAALSLQVTTRSVGADGVVQGTPLAGVPVELAGGAGWSVRGANPTMADESGRARWELVCQGAGAQPLRLVVGGTDPFNLALPACVEPVAPAPPSSAPASSPTTRAGSPPTTRAGAPTTRAPAAGATTTTTRPPTTRPRP